MSDHLDPRQEQLCEQADWDFSGLRALYINCTLKRSPEVSNTEALADRSIAIMRRLGVTVEVYDRNPRLEGARVQLLEDRDKPVEHAVGVAHDADSRLGFRAEPLLDFSADGFSEVGAIRKYA